MLTRSTIVGKKIPKNNNETFNRTRNKIKNIIRNKTKEITNTIINTHTSNKTPDDIFIDTSNNTTDYNTSISNKTPNDIFIDTPNNIFIDISNNKPTDIFIDISNNKPTDIFIDINNYTSTNIIDIDDDSAFIFLTEKIFNSNSFGLRNKNWKLHLLENIKNLLIENNLETILEKIVKEIINPTTTVTNPNIINLFDFYLEFPDFNIDYYKNFTKELENLSFLELINHFIIIGNNSNKDYLKFDEIITNYIERTFNEHKNYDDAIWRNINYESIKEYHKKKKFYIYNEESFYKLYSDFDYDFYKNKYFNNETIKKINILSHYHLIGKYNNYLINNKIKIIIYTRPFDINCGGIVALHNLAKCINESNNSQFYAKLFIYNNLKYDNIFCNNFATLDEINDNTVVVYPEVISTNPLKCKTVIRWILLALGIEMPLNHYKKWNQNDIIYHWESITDTKQLCTPFYNKIFTNKNSNNRSKTCYLIKKGPLIHKKINFIHNNDSICIKDLNLEEIADVFNNCEYFYSYDPNTAYIIFAVMCGCISVVHPIKHISKNEYFKNRIFNNNGNITNYGIAYGNSKKEIDLAKSTLNNQYTYEDLFNSYKINHILLDIENKLK